MRQIAREVGVQAGALYNYIPDKQTLLFTLMRDHLQTLLDHRAAATIPEGALAQLEEFIRCHIRFHMQRPNEVFIAYMELRNLSPENLTAISVLRDRYEAELQGILNRGVQTGALKVPDTKIATRAMIAMLNGVHTWYREGGPLTLDEVEETYWAMVRQAAGA